MMLCVDLERHKCSNLFLETHATQTNVRKGKGASPEADFHSRAEWLPAIMPNPLFTPKHKERHGLFMIPILPQTPIINVAPT